MNVQLTLLDINKIKPYAAEILENLPAERRQKILRYLKEEDRLRGTGSSLLIMLASNGQKIQYGKYGKPFAAGKNFNVSHSGNFVVLAESENSVGIDIEEVKEIEPELIEASLTNQEKLWAGKSPLRFFILWTRKESLLKCIGTGFNVEPNQIDVLPKKDFMESVNYRGKFYFVRSLLFANYVISVALLDE